MEIQSNVRNWFLARVEAHPRASNELKRSLKKNHPRVNQFVTRLAQELTKAQAVRLKSGKPAFKEKLLKEIVFDFTDTFILGIEGEATRRIESDLKKAQREKEAQDIKDMEATLAGKPQGIFEEMGVVTNEALDKEREETFEQKT